MSDVKAAGYTLAVKWTDTLYMATDRTTVRPFVRPTRGLRPLPTEHGYKQVVASCSNEVVGEFPRLQLAYFTVRCKLQLCKAYAYCSHYSQSLLLCLLQLYTYFA